MTLLRPEPVPVSKENPYRLSNSEIQTYKDCKRKWYLNYYRRLRPKTQEFSGPLALGSRVHKALEVYYSTDEELLTVWAMLVAEDRALLEAAGRDTSDFTNEAELGRIMLEGYLQWNEEEGIDADLDIIASEQRLITPLLDGRVELMAKLDQRVQRKVDGVRLFRDFKTSANFSDLTRTAHMNEQIMTYMLIEATQRDEKERSEGALFTMLKKVKRTASARPPFYDQMEVRHNVFTLRNFWARLHGEILDLLKTKTELDMGADHHAVAYPRPSRECTWKCQYFAICPLMDDGSAVEQAIVELYEEGSPYAYYGDDDPEKDRK